jgi:DUF1009 family protein
VSGAPLGIIAGSGSIPVQVARAARDAGRAVFIAALSGSGKPEDYPDFDAQVFGLGQLGALKSACAKRGVRDIIFIGGIVRPGIGDIKPDFGVVRHWAAVMEAFRKGDDGLLKGIIGIFEAQGFRVVDPLSVAPQLAADKIGSLGRVIASEQARAEIDQARAVIKALSPFDVGQAVIVSDGRPVAIEGAEGTDGLLARVAELRRARRLPQNAGGVLVKAPKDGQDMRIDLPTIGPSTMRGAQQAGLTGVAVTTGSVMIADKAETIALADELGLFIEAGA